MSGRQESLSFHSESSDFVLKGAAQPAGRSDPRPTRSGKSFRGLESVRAGSETPVPRTRACSRDGTIDSRDGYGPLTPVAGQATVVAAASRLRQINTPVPVDAMAGAGRQFRRVRSECGLLKQGESKDSTNGLRSAE